MITLDYHLILTLVKITFRYALEHEQCYVLD